MLTTGEKYIIGGTLTIFILGGVAFAFRKSLFTPGSAIDSALTSVETAVGDVVTSTENIILSAQQESFISNLNVSPGVQDKFRALIDAITKSGWQVILTSGYRDFAAQAVQHAADSKNAAPGLSAHDYGMAIDINAKNIATGKQLMKASTKQEWLDSGIPQLAKSMGFKWGGYDSEAEYQSAFEGIKSPFHTIIARKKENKSQFAGYYDPVHFEIPINTTALLAQGKAQFGSDVTQIQGNQILIS